MASENAHFDEMIRQFYARCLQVVLESRIPSSSVSWYGSRGLEGTLLGKTGSKGSCFNLLLGSSNPMLEKLEPCCRGVHQPLVIDILLKKFKGSGKDTLPVGGISQLRKALSLDAGLSEHIVLLERWVVHFNATSARGEHVFSPNREELSAVYKKSVIMLRSLYSMARLLPAHGLYCSSSSCKYHLSYKLSLSPPPLEEKGMSEYCFTPVESPCGQMCLSVTYRPKVPSTFHEHVSPLLPKIIPNYIGSRRTDHCKQERAGELLAAPSLVKCYGWERTLSQSKQMAFKDVEGCENRHLHALEDDYLNKVKEEDLDCPFALPASDDIISEGVEVGLLVRLFKAAPPLRGMEMHPSVRSDGMLFPYKDGMHGCPSKAGHDGHVKQKYTKTTGDAIQEFKLYIELRDKMLSN